jgi:hypothetical protein
MTSLALLAHATRAADPAFNGLFYATAATVIPVLFLAIAVQGFAYQQVLQAMMALNAFGNALARVRRRQRYRYRFPGVGTIASLRLSTIAIMIFAAAIPFLGVTGEVSAIIALYQQQAGGNAPYVIAATILLTAVAAGGPAIVFVTAISGNLPGESVAERPATGEPPQGQGHTTADGP